MSYLVYLYLFIGWSWAMHSLGFTLGTVMSSDKVPSYSPLYAFTGRIVEQTLLWPYDIYLIFIRRIK